jgi:hypothetical protein
MLVIVPPWQTWVQMVVSRNLPRRFFECRVKDTERWLRRSVSVLFLNAQVKMRCLWKHSLYLRARLFAWLRREENDSQSW